MSLQNLLLRQYLTLRVKRRLVPDVPFGTVRRELDEAIATYMPPTPDHLEIDAVAGDIAAEWVRPKRATSELTILYFHGGGFVSGSPRSHRGVSCGLASAARCAVLMPEYRLAPEHPYPAALQDAQQAYRWLLAQGTRPGHLVIAGDQAGAWLAFSLLLALRDAGEALPCATVALSPLVDMTLAGVSVSENAKCDPASTPDALRRCVDAFAPKVGREEFPLSPLFADLRGLPPTLIHVSTIELLRDDARRMATQLAQSGCQVNLREWKNVPPMWHIFASGLPEAREAIEDIAVFLRRFRGNVR